LNGSVDIALADYAPVSLDEMDSVKLMDRSDTKFTFHAAALPAVLEEMKAHYRVLEVAGHRRIRYESVYFDTDGRSLYHHHQCGRLNRYKVRYRRYVESGIRFFEIKYKNNKGRTVKSRIRDDAPGEVISAAADTFLRSRTPMTAGMLHPEVHIDFTRITLVNRASPERVTIDTGIVFHNGYRESLDHLVIAEAKQERTRRSAFVECMRRRRIRPGSLSKYCFAVATLHPGIRQNNFKEKLNHIHKLTHDAAAGPGRRPGR